MQQPQQTQSAVIQPTWVDHVFRFVIGKRGQIIFGFKILYVLLLVLLMVGGWSIYSRDANYIFFYNFALQLSRTAIIVYILTLIPGMARRLGLQHKLISILMIFRRYIGILMYVLVFIHYWWIAGITIWFRKILILPVPLMQVVGLVAFMLLIPMVLTSNDWAVKRLGKWWHRIHKLTYIIIFLIFFHVALQRLSIWTVLIGGTAVIQLFSFIYSRYRSKSSITSVFSG